jgi:hypothetical protein
VIGSHQSAKVKPAKATIQMTTMMTMFKLRRWKGEYRTLISKIIYQLLTPETENQYLKYLIAERTTLRSSKIYQLAGR